MAKAASTVTKKRRREETRQKLLDSAFSVFATHGYERATVDEIVREAGFSKGAFYVHFESKEDLFWAMLDGRIDVLQETMRGALDTTQSAAENDRRVLEAIFALDKQDRHWPALFVEFVAQAARNERVRGKLNEMYRRWHSFTVELLEEGRLAGRVRKDLDVDFMASVTMALIEGSLMQSRLAPDSVNLDSMVEPLSRLIGDWLEPQTP
ncbi:MAG TPA: TetR/AcrR family transcriptional regulator [Dehalococcoidia bacterium]|nr:TetR/AcrR family transcriptional regulator [Dehalococcoidia bacterium]